MALIYLQNINKSYGKSNTTVEALKNINLNINAGEFIAIIGTSGSGKSTLLNIIGCLDKADSGEYLLDSKSVKSLSNKRLSIIRNKTFGFIVQYFGLIDDYTIYENIQIPLEYTKISFKKRRIMVKAILEKLEIDTKMNSTPKELSGGQNQRVAIARALINNPEVILADEPTGALDKATATEVMNIFQMLNNEGKTIIIVTHDEKIASKSKRIIRIEDGIIIKDTLTQKVGENY